MSLTSRRKSFSNWQITAPTRIKLIATGEHRFFSCLFCLQSLLSFKISNSPLHIILLNNYHGTAAACAKVQLGNQVEIYWVDFYWFFCRFWYACFGPGWNIRMRPCRSPPHLGGCKSKGAELARIDTIGLDQFKQVPLSGDTMVRSLSYAHFDV